MVDCVLSYAATGLMGAVTTPGEASKQMLETLKADPRAACQFLLLTHLYARADVSSLAHVRRQLLRPKYTAVQVSTAVMTYYY